MSRILWIVFAIIIALWLVGVVARIAGALVHILLVVAAIVLVYNLVTGRRNG